MLKRRRGGGALLWREVAALLREAMPRSKAKPSLSDWPYLGPGATLQSRPEALISEPGPFRDAGYPLPWVKRPLAKRLRKQPSGLLTLLVHEGVDATNNRAERALGPGVMVGKRGGCNKTEAGARVPGILTWIRVRAPQQGFNPVVYLAKLLVDGAKLPSLTEAAPAL